MIANVRTQAWRNLPDPGYLGRPPLPSAVGSRVCGGNGSGSPCCWMEPFEEHYSLTLTIAIIPTLVLTIILDHDPNPGSNSTPNPDAPHAFSVLLLQSSGGHPHLLGLPMVLLSPVHRSLFPLSCHASFLDWRADGRCWRGPLSANVMMLVGTNCT